MSDIKINWIPVKDQLPNKLVDNGNYEPISFVTVQYSEGHSRVKYKEIQYGVFESDFLNFDPKTGHYKYLDGIGWRYYDVDYECWRDFESTFNCKVIAWSRDDIKPYKEDKNVS